MLFSGALIAARNSGRASASPPNHLPIALQEGTYRIRRQRELEPRDAQLIND